MADIDFVFEDDTSSTSDYDPNAGYEYFVGGQLNLGVGSINAIMKNAAKAKQLLRQKSKRVVQMKFQDLVVDIHNNNYPGFQNNPLKTTDLTMHRLTGYAARYVIEEYNKAISVGDKMQAAVWKEVINPIALSHGVTWEHGPIIYMSFAPGAEMFMDVFSFYPLAIGIYKAKQDPDQAQYLKKALRQRYNGQRAEVWMQKSQTQIQKAVDEISKLPWTKSSMSEAARKFLAKFGIKI
uniref:Nucleoprotein n=1 Tax=Mapputta virus TaxID=1590835 RepID=A0A0R7FK82_9VIRU|nr:nucleocapsid protein [Mapputta virus]